ncbi:Ger(x)C family spore germination protein [Fictibacillus phosphorivorans]|uniref:Ger(x)C family spore germination protein n=1 Tax=Fictibacillus phosphorivorans TaxID=1221500 RepID=UPI00203CC649|nr:Ger(x)C family spore germination protein [Fictibacillus phosphorivorans]MCM3718575.1 Ger(x)C family spore germination protein [Fictibacillus phosphorivorans]MCM3776198.1 Ger(x)C family spore germination protein [Fictibacillus phosphorivorans]
MKVLKCFIPFSLCLLILTGCWDQNELDELSIVMGIGINLDNKGHLIVTYQVVNPTTVAPGLMGEGGGKQPIFTVYESKGKNLMEATRNASKETSRRLFFAHARMLVFSEKLAKKNIYEALDMMSRDPEVRSTIQVLIARNTTPSKILRTFTAIDKVTSDEVTAILNITEQNWGENVQQDINEVLQSIINEGGEPLINGIELTGDKDLAVTSRNYEVGEPARVKLSGMGVFKKGKLKGWLDGPNARGVLWLKGKIKSTVVTVPCNNNKKGYAIEVVRSNTELSASTKGDVPTIDVKVFPETNIAETNCSVNLQDPSEIVKIEKEFNNVIQKEIMKTVKAAQGYNSDILGFGELLYRENPKKWNHMYKKKYNRVFPEIKVQVKVDSRIRRSGIRTSPFLFDKKIENKEEVDSS